jgi:protein gp37
MSKTTIEWTDRSVNPIRAGRTIIAGNGYEIEDVKVGHYCEMVSPGCAHCYSSRFQPRFGMPQFKSKPNGASPFFDPKQLTQVLTRKKPTKWFWCDMTDMFGSWVPDEWIDQCFAVMALTPQHTHQVLTKRPERMHAWFMRDQLGVCGQKRSAAGFVAKESIAEQVYKWHEAQASNGYRISNRLPFHPLNVGEDLRLWRTWPLPNVWLGTSCEDQQRADERIPWLLKTPAAVRFVSAEPLLGPIDFGLRNWAHINRDDCRLDWVIVGGESGAGARPCSVDWIRSIVHDCDESGVACFVKQLGALPVDSGSDGLSDKEIRAGREFYCLASVKHSKGGEPSEWPEDLRVREFPREVAHAS